jgi:hypothetical protein
LIVLIKVTLMFDPDTRYNTSCACFCLWCLFSQFSGCWLILSVYILMSFDFPFVRLFGVRYFCYYPYSTIFQLFTRRSIVLEETGENHRSIASQWQTLSYNVVSSTPCLSGIWTHNVGGNSTGSYQSNYHTITTTTVL